MSRPKLSLSRPRGAQLGNRNALKHGFYARKFRTADLAGLDDLPPAGLQDEITMMRVATRRLLEKSREAVTLQEYLEFVRVLCLASTALTRLHRAQNLIAPASDDIRTALQEALQELYAETGIKDETPSG